MRKFEKGLGLKTFSATAGRINFLSYFFLFISAYKIGNLLIQSHTKNSSASTLMAS
jgi:hypothetical protein